MRKILALILLSFGFVGCYEDYRTIEHTCERPHIYVPANPSVVIQKAPNESSWTGECQGLVIGDPKIPQELMDAPECSNYLFILCPNTPETWTEEFIAEEKCLYTMQVPGSGLGSFVCCQSEQPQ